MTGNGVVLPILRSGLTAARRLSPRWWLEQRASTAADLYLVVAVIVSLILYEYAQPVRPGSFTKFLAVLCFLRLAEILHGVLDWLVDENSRGDSRRHTITFLLNIVEVAAWTAAAGNLTGLPVSFADSLRDLLSLEPPPTFAFLTERLLGWARLAIGLLLLVGAIGSVARDHRPAR